VRAADPEALGCRLEGEAGMSQPLVVTVPFNFPEVNETQIGE